MKKIITKTIGFIFSALMATFIFLLTLPSREEIIYYCSLSPTCKLMTAKEFDEMQKNLNPLWGDFYENHFGTDTIVGCNCYGD